MALPLPQFLCSLPFCVLAAWAISSVALAADPGKIMFIGDSITQGGNFLDGPVASYRYQLFRNFVDNGIEYRPLGTTEGAAWHATPDTPDYRGKRFVNVSEAAASGRTYHVCGHGKAVRGYSWYRKYPTSVNVAADRGPLTLKFGQENPCVEKGLRATHYVDGGDLVEYKGDTYAGKYGSMLAQTACIMMGINDKYDQMSPAGKYAFPDANIVENTHRIVQILQAYNPDIHVVVMGLLPVGAGNLASRTNVTAYNALLRQEAAGWSVGNSRVVYADVSTGFCAARGEMIDTAAGAHPNAQGELIVAGNLARVLGVGQRTLGYVRKGSSGLEMQADLSAALPEISNAGRTKSMLFSRGGRGVPCWTAKGGGLSFAKAKGTEGSWLQLELSETKGSVRTGTYDFSICMNRAASGEDAANNLMTIVIGDGKEGAAVFSVGERGIYWGGSMEVANLLYGTESHAGTAHSGSPSPVGLRVVIAADRAGHARCHIWLGDQLIGENLRTNLLGSWQNGLLVGSTSVNNATFGCLLRLSCEQGATYAPADVGQIP